jgi:transcriptional regulator with XRE-family HTH domain
MDGVGGRLRSRAVELGLSDAEVARRAGLTSTRYGHYVTDTREPDLATLVRICRVLGTTPDELLGFDRAEQDELAERRRSVAGFAEIMDGSTLDIAVAVMHALAATLRLGPGVQLPESARRAGRQIKREPPANE